MSRRRVVGHCQVGTLYPEQSAHADRNRLLPGKSESDNDGFARRILDDTRLPYVHVMLDPSWHLLGDLHADPRAAQAIAIAGRGTVARPLR
jgi:hypothetical protein